MISVFNSSPCLSSFTDESDAFLTGEEGSVCEVVGLKVSDLRGGTESRLMGVNGGDTFEECARSFVRSFVGDLLVASSYGGLTSWSPSSEPLI